MNLNKKPLFNKQKYISIILKIINDLKQNNIDYFIYAGTSLFLRNIIDDTDDIDIVVSFKNLRNVKKIYSKKIIIEKKYSLIINIDDQNIEFFGYPKRIDPISFKVLKNKNKYIDYFLINKINLKLINLEKALELYKFVYNRDKKEKHKKRIKLIENILKNKGN